MQLKNVINHISQLLFPATCIGCNTPGNSFCKNCLSTIRILNTPSCYLCGAKNQYGETCRSHLHKPQRLNGLIVAAHYSGNPLLKKAIHQLKYQHQRSLHKSLSALLHDVFMKHFLSSSQIKSIPVPLHKSRFKERGFNQSDLLAKLFTDSPSPQKQLLFRSLQTPPQAACRNRKQRLKNLKGVFSCSQQLNKDTTYLLIDDVCTTGSTLEECCKTLRKNGATTVWGLVLARN